MTGRAHEPSAAKLARFRRLVEGERLPCALIDLDAFDTNVKRLLTMVRGSGKTLRVATKSLRCPSLIARILERGEGLARGLMTYDAAETAYLASLGYDDLLLAYPTLHTADLARIADLNARGVAARVVVDAPEHLEALSHAARAASTTIPAVIEVDVAYRPLGSSLHLGVRRSPLRSTHDVVAFVSRIERTEGVVFGGLMAYEAHIAGLADNDPLAPVKSLAMRAMKERARVHVESTRRKLANALSPTLFNGGGSGSLAWCTKEPWLTEVTAGSGFLDSHLFDHYVDLDLEPAAYYGLEVVRAPAPGIVTCRGGGFVASGAAGLDRLPKPALPEGLALLPMEGAGEVQTPLLVPPGTTLSLGDVVFFRHAKAGELAEHVSEYLLVRGDTVVERAKTYRGEGFAF